jgi:guanosine-3',5'-bis(diphosphate) 3'-pyrophosphohydrolase
MIMMDRKTFFAIMRHSFGVEDLGMISEAYQLAKAFHRPQQRKSGERYFEHPRSVALILVQEFGGSSVREVVGSLFHDGVEDCFILPRTLAKIFGPEVASDVMLLTKFDVRLEIDGGITKTKKEMRRYWAEISSGSREARRIKCADRLHNLRSMMTMSEAHKRKQVDETREYMLPIADSVDPAIATMLRLQADIVAASLSA